ncbi:EAL domain-containing protein [Massilia cavernae]|uniref:EAL domain-containing protein n=2 Tax=Massilia cavernae TaxID=2320864 RepID=A0A418XPP7_9BURK|nr:EAL domain-containing protein [Massilia cavernae]
MAYPADEKETGVRTPVPDKHEEELVRLNRALRTLSAGNRALLRMTDEQDLLHEMCQVIVETGGYAFACVAYAVHDEAKSLRWMAGVGTDIALLDTFHFTWADTEFGNNLPGAAIRTGQPIVGVHIEDPAYAGEVFAPIREHIIQHGYASFTAFPLRVEGQVLGVLAIAANEPDAFDEEEVKLLSELADDLAYGITNLRTHIQKREAQATITRLAYYDTLTGLANRTRLVEELEAAIDDAKRQRHALAVLHLEVGHFRAINKVLGYRAGDELLQTLSRRLSSEIQSKEILARVGEAEFALLLPDGGAEYAIQVAQRLLIVLLEPVEVAQLTLDARVAIGIALFPGHATNAEFLLRRANVAMHQANLASGGYAMYTEGQEQEHTRRLALMGDLHRAIKNSELRLFCQPKVDIQSRRVCGAEALVRWQHPQHGNIPTFEFIQLAEEAGTITPLTNWMLEAAFSQTYAWHEAGLEWPLAVNLSGHDLYDPRLIERIRGMFSTWGIAPSLIQFELTESAVMANPTACLETLARLKQLDVKLFIDDYGTGYSSLSYLQKLPIDAVKIDQSFVMPMVINSNSAMIVSSTIELGHNLGLTVVAEGVDSQAVWDRLAALKCDVAQGYHISMPMPAEQFQAWSSAWSQGSHCQ